MFKQYRYTCLSQVVYLSAEIFNLIHEIMHVQEI